MVCTDVLVGGSRLSTISTNANFEKIYFWCQKVILHFSFHGLTATLSVNGQTDFQSDRGTKISNYNRLKFADPNIL